MLVLTRKSGDRINITVPPSAKETYIEIEVLGMDRGKVRIGFRADREVQIFRSELLERQDKWEQET